MNVDQTDVRTLCTDSAFERGQTYRTEGHVHRIYGSDDRVRASVQGSSLYDVTIERNGDEIDARCTCPYDDPGACKHIVAVLLDVAAGAPADDGDRIEAVLEELSPDELRTVLREACVDHPDLRDRLLARYGPGDRTLEEFRPAIEQLFESHASDRHLVTDSIDFSRFFDLANQYRRRGHHLAAATVYRALFEVIDDNQTRIDAAYDHYATALQSALDGYAECIATADLAPETFDSFASVLEDRATAASPPNSEQFRRALEELDGRR